MFAAVKIEVVSKHFKDEKCRSWWIVSSNELVSRSLSTISTLKFSAPMPYRNVFHAFVHSSLQTERRFKRVCCVPMLRHVVSRAYTHLLFRIKEELPANTV